MLQDAYLVAIIGADTAKNEPTFASFLGKGNLRVGLHSVKKSSRAVRMSEAPAVKQ